MALMVQTYTKVSGLVNMTFYQNQKRRIYYEPRRLERDF